MVGICRLDPKPYGTYTSTGTGTNLLPAVLYPGTYTSSGHVDGANRRRVRILILELDLTGPPSQWCRAERDVHAYVTRKLE